MREPMIPGYSMLGREVERVMVQIEMVYGSSLRRLIGAVFGARILGY